MAYSAPFSDTTRKWVFYDCKNMIEDDWRLVAIIFLKVNTLGRNMIAKYNCQLILGLVLHRRVLYSHWEQQSISY